MNNKKLSDLSSLLEPICERRKVPALGVAVISSNQLNGLGVAGVRKYGSKTSVTTKDLWHIGSCTKAMTATLVASLVEDEIISWDTKVVDFFKHRKVFVNSQWSPATLRHLINHTAGAPASALGTGIGSFWIQPWKSPGPVREIRMEGVSKILRGTPISPSGKKYEYSNIGYAIAACMVEEATNTTYEDLIKKRIFEPLGMQTAEFGAPDTTGKLHHPWGHKSLRRPINDDNPPAANPAGRLHCTLGDWSTFIIDQMWGEKGRGKVLTQESYKNLHKLPKYKGAYYALGWIIEKRKWARGAGGEGKIWMHAGSNGLWFAVAWVAPEIDFAVIATCNQGGETAQNACDEVTKAILKNYRLV